MANKSHLKFLSKKQLSEVKVFKYNYGPISKDDEKVTPKNYSRLAASFRADLARFNSDREEKYSVRDHTLEIDYDIDYVQITFQGIYAIKDTWEKYYNDFGLEATAFYDFAKKGLFAIIDRDKFQTFINSVHNFIEYTLEGKKDLIYSNYVKYISSFKLLRSNDILKFKLEDIGNIVYLSLIDLQLQETVKQIIVHSLIIYIEANAIIYKYDQDSDRIELQNPAPDQIQKIIQNFDIIESATCSAFSTVRPGEFNAVERKFGFIIQNADEDLPVVGIIDTGISQQSALAPILLNDTTFTLAGNPLIDQAGRNRLGHGTAVAGLVALGKHNHKNNFEGEIRAHAKLLSIKISNNGNGYISEVDLLKMLYAVKAKYPGIRLFTLTTCYSDYLDKNEAISDYTFSLDKFAYETNSLIFICTGNNNNCINENTDYDLSYFHKNHTNLSTPADSLNNFTVGAAADNLREDMFFGIASGRKFPALYTRKGHIDLSEIYTKKTNKHYFKPDVIESGGDINYNRNGLLDWMNEPALTLLSARPEIGNMQEVGTSFAAPLVANLAARIIKNYPTLSNESVKALIINGASLNLIPFKDDVLKLRNRVVGNGFVDEFKSLYSDINTATLILEDTIISNKIKVYPINFPEYLINDNLGKVKKRLKITATLCFKFMPIQNNQLSYNPIHMAFSIFKNHSVEEIIGSDKKIKSKLRTNLGWSEDGRFPNKPLPYSNTQKITLNVSVDDLVNEKNTFKLAVHSKLSEQIVGGLPENYPREFPFSIVLMIEETIKNSTGKLYDKIQLINNLEAIQDVDIDSALEANALDV